MLFGVFDGNLVEGGSDKLSFFEPESILFCLSNILIGRMIAGEEIGTFCVSKEINEVSLGLETDALLEGGYFKGADSRLSHDRLFNLSL